MKTQMVKAAGLIMDYTLYPRHQISDQNVRDIARAREAGIVMPPVIVDRKTKRIVDGWHRVTEALRTDGPNAKVRAEWHDYKDEAQMFLDAMRYNAIHGCKLSAYDQARCLIRGRELKLEPDVIASALSMTADRLANLEMRKTAIGPDHKIIPIKRTLQHLAGQPVTQSQVDGNRNAVGHHQMFLINQVINLLENDLVNTEDERIMERLQVLAGLLGGFAKAA